MHNLSGGTTTFHGIVLSHDGNLINQNQNVSFKDYGGWDMEVFNRKIWLSSPTMHGEEIRYMTEAYETNWMSTVGQNIHEAERLVCNEIGCEYAVALTTGTAALHMAVKLAGIKPGERVFCSDMTFAATVNPLLYEKAVPVFIDSERETWNMDPEALEKAFELFPEVKVVIVVHLYGTPAKMDEIKAVCERHGAVIIEDAAESLGSVYKGMHTGSLGRYSCISFNGNKIITGSSGGMLLTNDRNAAALVRKWSTQSREEAPWYQHEDVGYNYRMSNVIAGVIRGQFPYLEEHIARKREIYERYQEGLRDLPVSMNPYETQNSVPNFWLSCMLIHKEAMCTQNITERSADYRKEVGRSCPTEILRKLSECNVEARPVWKPMHMQPIFRNEAFVTRKGLAQGKEDVSSDVFGRGLCLPSDIKMTEKEQNAIIRIIRSCFD